MKCKHNSDTFDPILDLSLDIRKCDTMREAMDSFTAVEELRGSEKYRCEKCRTLVNAKKHFKVEQCPNVLTIHLKRFTFTGAKVSRPVGFPERFQMRGDWTSSGEEGPRYTLYAVVHHYGSGPHSGHYVAQVKSPSQGWTEMNDEMVRTCERPGMQSKSAYILFYVRDAKESLGKTLQSLHEGQQGASKASQTSSPQRNGNGHGATHSSPPMGSPMQQPASNGHRHSLTKKLKRALPSDDGDEDRGVPSESPSVARLSGSKGPLLHRSSSFSGSTSASSNGHNSNKNSNSSNSSPNNSSSTGGGNGMKPRFSQSNGPRNHGSDFLSRISSGSFGSSKLHKKPKLDGPIAPERFHRLSSGGGGGGVGGGESSRDEKGNNGNGSGGVRGFGGKFKDRMKPRSSA